MLLPVVWSHAPMLLSLCPPQTLRGTGTGHGLFHRHVKHPGHSCGETVSLSPMPQTHEIGEPFLRAKLEMLPLRQLLVFRASDCGSIQRSGAYKPI